MIMRGIAMGRVAEMIEEKTPSRLRSDRMRKPPDFPYRFTALSLRRCCGGISRGGHFMRDLTRKGPGILLRDIERDKDKQIAALKQLVKAVDPNVLFLTKVDFDLEGRTARAPWCSAWVYEHTFTHTPKFDDPHSA